MRREARKVAIDRTGGCGGAVSGPRATREGEREGGEGGGEEAATVSEVHVTLKFRDKI